MNPLLSDKVSLKYRKPSLYLKCTMELKLFLILLVVFTSFLAAIGQVFFKLGTTNLTLNFYSIITNWKIF